jgi:hypothetical protein
MKLHHLFIVNIFVAIFFGGSCTLFPHFVYSLYNVFPDGAAIWACRLTGGSILGFATLMWFGIKTSSAESRRAIAIALLVQDTIGFIASLVFQIKDEVNIFGWLSLALYGILALAYAYFLFIRPDKSQKAIA